MTNRPIDCGLRHLENRGGCNVLTNDILSINIVEMIEMYPIRHVGLILIALIGVSAPIWSKEVVNPSIESEQLAILRSDVPGGEKAIACKLLAIHGSSNAVEDLAILLSDPELSSWARIARRSHPWQGSR